jgi:hypothetical protein
MLKAKRSRVQDRMKLINLFNLPVPSGRTRPCVNSISNINGHWKQKIFLWSKARPLRRAYNVTAICEPIV